MDSAHKFEVLKGLKILMKLVELYPANWYIWKFRISIPLIFRTLVLNMILFLYTTLWLCYSYDWNLKLISGSVCFVFGVLFLFNSHFSMMYSKSIIVDSVTLLQQLVEQRKIYRIFFFVFWNANVTASKSIGRLCKIIGSIRNLPKKWSEKYENSQIYLLVRTDLRNFFMCNDWIITYILSTFWISSARKMVFITTNKASSIKIHIIKYYPKSCFLRIYL